MGEVCWGWILWWIVEWEEDDFVGDEDWVYWEVCEDGVVDDWSWVVCGVEMGFLGLWVVGLGE